MVAPISSLANMEMQLYGGMGTNFNAPSYLNGYTGASFNNNAYSNLSFYGYNTGYNQAFGQTIPSNYMQGTQTTQGAQASVFGGLTSAEQKALLNTYKKGLEPIDKLALGGMATTAIMQNPRVIAHPWNTLRTFFGFKDGGATNKMFESLRDSKLWKDHAYVMEEAFSQMNRTEARSMTKLGLFRKQYSSAEYTQLKDIMEKALKSGDIDEIAKATEQLRNAQVNNGKIPGLWNKIRGKENPTVATGLADTATIAKNTSLLVDCKNMTYAQAWNRAGGTIGLVWGGINLLGSVGKIKTAFEADTKTGFKQLGQSVVKSAADAVGWQAGEAFGIWASAKVTPSITKALGPKWGTIVAALARPACALFTSWASRKVAKAAVGDDVVNEIEAKKAASTQQGQQQILTNLVERMQKGEKIDPEAQLALQKIMLQQSA